MKAILLCLLAAAPLAAQPLQLKASLAEQPVRLGTQPLFQLELRNTGKTTVTFTYFRPSFWYPELEDASGKKYTASFPPYDGPAQKVTLSLQPGGVEQLTSSPCLFSNRVESSDRAFIKLEPGRYRARFQIEKLHSQPLLIQVVK